MKQRATGTREFLENVLNKRGRGNTREKKLAAVLVYLHAQAVREMGSNSGLVVGKIKLAPFTKKGNSRHELLYALDGREHTALCFHNLYRPSCIRVEYASGCSREKGNRITGVRLLQKDVMTALCVLGHTLGSSIEEMLRYIGCEEKDFTQMNGKGMEVTTITSSLDTSGKKKETSAVAPPQTSKDKLLEATRLLHALTLSRGHGSFDENLQKVLDALWRASEILGTPGIVEEEVIRAVNFHPNGKPTGRARYLTELFERGCFSGEKTRIRKRKSSVPSFICAHLSARRVLETEQKSMSAVGKPAKENKHRTATFKTIKESVPGHATLQVPPGYALVRLEDILALKAQEKRGDPTLSLPVTSQNKDERDNENAAVVFVDTGNLVGARSTDGGQGGNGRLLLKLENINWQSLFRFIKKGPKGNEILKIKKANIYLYEKSSGGRYAEINAEAAGFMVVYHHKTNTDVPMAIDIGCISRDMMEHHRRLTVVVVSGDSDFDRARELKKIAQGLGVNLALWFIGWNGSIGKSILKIADNVSHVQNIPDLALFAN